jgi:hypothetical protein
MRDEDATMIGQSWEGTRKFPSFSFPGFCPEHYPYAGSLDTGHMFHINAMHTSNTAKPKYAGNIRGA